MDESQIIKEMLLIGYLPDYFLRQKLHSNQKKPPRSNPYQTAIYLEHRKQLSQALGVRTALFKRKYKIGFKENLKKAKHKDLLAISKLLQWDITFLFEDWLKNMLVAAWAADSKSGRKLIEALADSVRSRKNKGKTRQSGLLHELKLLKVFGFNFNDTKKVEMLRKTREKFLSDNDVSENDPEYKILDKEYFSKWLKRNGLRTRH